MRFILWEKFKAWRRGEVMVKGITRGRCFVKKDSKKEDTGSSGDKKAKGKATMKLVSIKVIRTDGTEEIIKHG